MDREAKVDVHGGFMRSLEEIVANPILPLPAEEDIYTGGSAADFRDIGVAVLRSLIAHAELRRDSRVVEIGSGIGRVAAPLAEWMGGSGSYLGFEIVFKGVNWCKANITTRYNNARFIHVDMFNEYYNKDGILKVFPDLFNQMRFDVAVFSSVFTHLTESDMRRFLDLMSKAVVPGGMVWSTWFLMDAEAQRCVSEARTSLNFCEKDGCAHYLSPEKSTVAVAFEETQVLATIDACGFDVTHVSKGNWCEREHIDGGYQDLLVFKRRA